MSDIRELAYTSNCRIVKLLAKGGMGSVYLAEQLGTHDFKKTVAIKTIRREHLKDETTLKMFVDEGKLVADLVHENIGQVYNLCSTDRLVYIVMEYIKGITLTRLVKKHLELKKKIPPEMSAFICSRLARALSYAHNKTDRDGVHLGIVHRDVTPSNVMIDTLGVVKLTDFGIAKAITMATPDEKTILMGKFSYMSPEQVSMKGTDRRSDIFTLGIIFYEMLTLKKLFKVKDRKELLDKFKTEEIIPPIERDPSVPKVFSDFVMQMLENNPEKRISSARKVVSMLEKSMYEKGYGPTNEKLSIYIRGIYQ